MIIKFLLSYYYNQGWMKDNTPAATRVTIDINATYHASEKTKMQ
jgi:hypothetical protein